MEPLWQQEEVGSDVDRLLLQEWMLAEREAGGTRIPTYRVVSMGKQIRKLRPIYGERIVAKALHLCVERSYLPRQLREAVQEIASRQAK